MNPNRKPWPIIADAIKLGDILKIPTKYCLGLYDFYKVVKVSPKTVKAILLQRQKLKLDDTGDGYGNFEMSFVDVLVDFDRLETLWTKTFKIKDIEKNVMTYIYELCPD